MSKSKKILQFDPNSTFEVAGAISKALSSLNYSEKNMVIRWALEAQGYTYPIKIQGGAAHP